MLSSSFFIFESVNTTCDIVHDQIDSVKPKKVCGELIIQQSNIDTKCDHRNADQVVSLHQQKCCSNDCDADQGNPDEIAIERGVPDSERDE